jgi:hypothetical protein
MPLDPGRVQAVFLEALTTDTPADRAAVLDRACAADTELRYRIEALLIAHDQPDSLLDRPLAEIAEVVAATGPRCEAERGRQGPSGGLDR